MISQSPLTRIVSHPGILAGKPTIRGTRLSVEYILNLLSYGATQQEILTEYDGITNEDITACVLFSKQGISN